MIKIYHNARCKKSRAGLQYLQERTDNIEVVEYIKNPIDEDTLKKLLIMLNISPLKLVRTQEAMYKSNLKGKNFTDYEWVKIMVENPKLIKRPIVIKGNKAILGDPANDLSLFFQ
ncbi:MAG: arsenate reductase (glutaredoxin) [Bacteroidetes bacterium]|nr:arsenate reductase (glutaredoxin) [Bacteroidota bacterium]